MTSAQSGNASDTAGCKGPVSGGKCFYWAWIWVPLLVLGLSTWVIRYFGIDFSVQSAIYEAGDRSWKFGYDPIWQFFYRFGTVPAIVVVIGTLVAYGASWSRKSLRKWHRICLFILLSAIVGPGLITNLGLKENWGRPRPKEVVGLGGHRAFEAVLTRDDDPYGKSFPCGHATMGFVFLAGFFLFYRTRPWIAGAFVVGGLLGGSLMGTARLYQGGHFLSDVLWSAGICWFVPLVLYFGLKLHRGHFRPFTTFQGTPLWMKILTWVVGLGLFTLVMLATPFRQKRDFILRNEDGHGKAIHLDLGFVLGDIDLVPGDTFHLTGEASGHGVPTSKIASEFAEDAEAEADLLWVGYHERFSGMLTEGNQQLHIEFPKNRTRSISLRTGEANLWLKLFEPDFLLKIDLVDGSGNVRLIDLDVPFQVVEKDSEGVIQPGTKILIQLHPEFEGKVLLGE